MHFGEINLAVLCRHHALAEYVSGAGYFFEFAAFTDDRTCVLGQTRLRRESAECESK